MLRPTATHDRGRFGHFSVVGHPRPEGELTAVRRFSVDIGIVRRRRPRRLRRGVGEECMLRQSEPSGATREGCFLFWPCTFSGQHSRCIDRLQPRGPRSSERRGARVRCVEALPVTDFRGVEKIGGEVYRPARLHNFAMYLDAARGTA